MVRGRASWGAWLALFVPVGHDAPVRQTTLQADAMDSADAEIDALGPDGLRALFDRSTLKDE